MGRFAGLADVTVNGGGIYFEPGNYLAEIKKIVFKDTRAGETFIVESEICESDNPARPAGTKASWVVVINPKYRETCLADIKAFAAALLGIEDPNSYNDTITSDDQITATQAGLAPQAVANERFWQQSLEALVSAENPGAGIKIRVCAYSKEKAKTKGEFITKVAWGPVVA